MTESNFPQSDLSQKQRWCILTTAFYPVVGGAESHALLLGETLIQHGHDVVVVTGRQLPETAKQESIRGIEVHRVGPKGYDRMGKYLMIPYAIKRMMTLRKRFDVIYVCGLRALGPAGVWVAKRTVKPCILRSESCGELAGTNFFKTKRNLRDRLSRNYLARRNKAMADAQSYLAISRAIKEEYVDCSVPADKIELIANGVDTTRYSPVDQDVKLALRKRLGLGPELTFCFTGKLNEGKGLQSLLRVWGRLSQDFKNIHLALVGSGSHQHLGIEDDLRRFVYEKSLRKSVTFTGYVRNVDEYLQAADFFVFPSESEALGISLIEAMACGLPAIATATGGILDIVDPEQNGLLVPVRDDLALETAMRRFLQEPDLANKLRRSGRESVVDRFGIEEIARQHMELYRTLTHGTA